MFKKSGNRPRGNNNKGKGKSFSSGRFARRTEDPIGETAVDYKEIDYLRKFLTTSSKLMSRKRAGTNAQEQQDLKAAVKRARYLALLPYSGT